MATSEAWGTYMGQLMRSSGKNVTKAAADLEVSFSGLSKWLAGYVPRDNAHLDRIALVFDRPQEEVYQMAGRWTPDLQHPELETDIAQLALSLQVEINAFEDPEMRQMALEMLKEAIQHWRSSNERMSEILKLVIEQQARAKNTDPVRPHL
jgi:transcriptional regulator with XRE-family HTH domain